MCSPSKVTLRDVAYGLIGVVFVALAFAWGDVFLGVCGGGLLGVTLVEVRDRV